MGFWLVHKFSKRPCSRTEKSENDFVSGQGYGHRVLGCGGYSRNRYIGFLVNRHIINAAYYSELLCEKIKQIFRSKKYKQSRSVGNSVSRQYKFEYYADDPRNSWKDALSDFSPSSLLSSSIT